MSQEEGVELVSLLLFLALDTLNVEDALRSMYYPPPLGSGLRRQLGSGMPLGWVKLPLGSGMTWNKLSLGSALFGSTAYIGSAH